MFRIANLEANIFPHPPLFPAYRWVLSVKSQPCILPVKQNWNIFQEGSYPKITRHYLDYLHAKFGAFVRSVNV